MVLSTIEPLYLSDLKTEGVCSVLPCPPCRSPQIRLLSTERPRPLEPYITSGQFEQVVRPSNDSFSKRWRLTTKRASISVTSIVLVMVVFIVASFLMEHQFPLYLNIIFGCVYGIFSCFLAFFLIQLIFLPRRMLQEICDKANHAFPQTVWSLVMLKQNSRRSIAYVIVVRKTTGTYV